MEGMNKKFNDEVAEMNLYLKQEYERMNLKEDFVRNQNENFRLQKEISVLCRDKLSIEEEIEKSLARVKELEMKIYKLEMYDLKVEDPYLNTVISRNLRSEHSGSLHSTQLLH